MAFFLMLFVFQQAQASAKITSDKNNSVQSISIQANGLPTQVYVTMLYLNERTGAPFLKNGDPQKCKPNDTNYGCVEALSGQRYPYGNNNPAWVDVENDYLLNVLPREMDVVTNPPTLAALQAQSLAARSIADWKYRFNNNYIDNSTNNQVFVPYSFEFYTRGSSLSDPTNPCNASVNSLNGIQQSICNGVTSTHGQYVSYDGSSMFAGFGSDTISNTVTYKNADGTAPYTYLQGVQDPISSACDAKNNGQDSYPPDKGKVYGMSQKGGIRWSLGNQCASGGDATTSWPVAWNDYRQILAHYYTGIDILDATGNEVAPDDRWNLLWHDNFNYPIGATPVLNGGQLSQIKIYLQNTSTTAWSANNIEVGYHWGDNNWQVASVSQIFPDIPAGNEFPDLTTQPQQPPVIVSVVPPSISGSYTLHLDLRRSGGTWFSEAGWPDAEIPVRVIAPTPTPTSTPMPTATPIVNCPVKFSLADYSTNYCQGTYPGPCQSTGTVTQSGGLITINENVDFNVGGWPRGGQGGFDSSIAIPPGTTMYVSYETSVSSDCAGAGVYVNGTLVTTSPAAFYNTGPWGYFFVRAMCVAGWDTHNVANIKVNLYSDPSCLSGPTPAPTLIPTPTPTHVPDPCPAKELLQNIFHIISSNSGPSSQNSLISLHSLSSVQQAVISLDLLYRVRDDILSKTAEGQRYIDLYYANGPEISKLLWDNRDLANEALATLNLWQSNLQALVDGQGSSVTITEEQVQAIQTFLDHLSVKGSPALQQIIANERARRPLEQAVGMKVDQAWTYLNGYTLTWLPPVSNANPDRAETGRTIPVEFTIRDFQGNFAMDEAATLKILDANGDIVAGPIGINDNPTQGISIQKEKYHYNFQTAGLADGLYMIQVSYNSASPGQPTIYTVQISKGKNK
ncbi:MAG: hypothetical protein HYX49_05060 [Chloroflexi bacterium]|nr:hypothetical protein [Chloroflexota bacterium]